MHKSISAVNATVKCVIVTKAPKIAVFSFYCEMPCIGYREIPKYPDNASK